MYAKQTLKNLKNINFSKVVFSDKSAIQRGHGARTEYYRKRRNNRVGTALVSTTNRSTFKNNLKRLKDLLIILAFF